jgi:hypothetical protein
MTREEVLTIVRHEIQRASNLILYARTTSSGTDVDNIDNLFAGMTEIVDVPKVEPYGFHSSAQKGTAAITARVGNDIANRIILGHRDAFRPVINPGETILYNQYGQQVYLSNGQVQIGRPNASSPVLLGDLVQMLFSNLLTELSTHTHLSAAPGSPTTPPVDAAAFLALKSSPVSDGAILSKTVKVS